MRDAILDDTALEAWVGVFLLDFELAHGVGLVGPAEGEHLAPAAPGEQEQPDCDHLKRPFALMGREPCPHAANLCIGQEPFAPLAVVSPDARQGLDSSGRYPMRSTSVLMTERMGMERSASTGVARREAS